MTQEKLTQLTLLDGDVSGFVVGRDGEMIPVRQIPLYTQEQLLAKLRTLKPIFYETITIDLGVARTRQAPIPFNRVGNFLGVEYLSGDASIVFNEPENPQVSLTQHKNLSTPFYRFYILNGAQAGSVLRLVIGRETLFTSKPAFSGEVYSNQNVALADLPRRFEALPRRLRDVVIQVSVNDQLFGDGAAQLFLVPAGGVLGFTCVDLSTLWFVNAGAGLNGTVDVIGTEE